MNAAKTEVTWCASSRRMHQVPAVPLSVGVDNVTPVSSVRDLGVYLDADVYTSPELLQAVSVSCVSCGASRGRCLVDWRT